MGIAHDVVMHGLHFVSRWLLGRSRARILLTFDLTEPEGKFECLIKASEASRLLEGLGVSAVFVPLLSIMHIVDFNEI